MPLVIGRMGYSHERCFELFLCDGSRGDELWERLWAAGSDLGISAGAPNLALRAEAGIYSYLTDMDAATNPFEIGLGWTVQLDCSDPFIGREALARFARCAVRAVALDTTAAIRSQSSRVTPPE